MTIHAIRQNINELVISRPLDDGDILTYSTSLGRFTNRKVVEFSDSVRSIENLGGENTVALYSNKDGNTAFFRTIEAGANMLIEQFDDRIVLTADTSPGNLSVNGDFSITIDNNNDKSDAVFEILTAASTNVNPITIFPKIVLPVTSENLFTGIENNESYFESINEINFIAQGFAEGMFISVHGTDYQDGEFTISRIENIQVPGEFISRIYLLEGFQDEQLLNLGGPKLPTTIFQADLVVAPVPDEPQYSEYNKNANNILISYSQDFGPNGFDLLPGMIFNLQGAGERTGTYTIAQVFPKNPNNPFEPSYLVTEPETEIGGDAGLILEEDPLNPHIKIQIKDFLVATGFSVNKSGEISSPTIEMLLKRIEDLEAEIQKLKS